jgi:hypothetical protein
LSDQQLATALEPLKLADGRIVDPATGKVSRAKSELQPVPRNEEVKLRQEAIQRRLADLPLPVEKMHGISVILTYTMFGLSNEDIAAASGLTIQQVANIKMTDAYMKLSATVIENIKDQDSDEIRAAIHLNAKKAVSVAKDILEEGSEAAQVAVMRDMLDRDGYRPADVIEHRHKMEGGLRVEIIRKREDVDTPIDVEFTPMEDTNGPIGNS